MFDCILLYFIRPSLLSKLRKVVRFTNECNAKLRPAEQYGLTQSIFMKFTTVQQGYFKIYHTTFHPNQTIMSDVRIQIDLRLLGNVGFHCFDFHKSYGHLAKLCENFM